MARSATRQLAGKGQRLLDGHSQVGVIDSALGGWEQRIYAGLLLPDIPADIREALARALGAAGVEAEYLLRLLATFPGPGGSSPAAGARLLDQLQSFARRFLDTANTLELTTQSYLTALQLSPGDGVIGSREGEPWWPPFPGYTLGGEPLELRLRRCGYSYARAAALRLGPLVEALAEQMALLLHALRTLPPAGIVSTSVLARGLDELADAMQGDVGQHLLRDMSDEYLGLPSAIVRLQASTPLDAAAAKTSLAADLAWARAEYERALGTAANVPAQKPGLFARLFGGSAPVNASQRWSASAAQEWRELIAALEVLQREQSAT